MSSLFIQPNLGISNDTIPSDGPEGVFVQITSIPTVNENELDEMLNRILFGGE